MITTKTCTILKEKTTDRMCSKYRYLTQVFIKTYNNCQKHQIHRFHKNTNAQQVVKTTQKQKCLCAGD